MIEEYSANKELDEVSLDLLEEALLIMEKLDYIKNKNNIEEILDALKIIMNARIIDFSFKKEILNNTIINNYYSEIENAFISIKFPIFDGKLLLGIFENIKQNNNYNLIKKYISVISSISSFYKEEGNHGNINKLQKKHEEVISNLIFKRLITLLLNHYNLNGDKKNKENLIDIIDTVISYISKCISNISELFNLISTNESENFEILLMVKYISNNLLSKINLYCI